jgi:hypothetical protein
VACSSDGRRARDSEHRAGAARRLEQHNAPELARAGAGQRSSASMAAPR